MTIVAKFACRCTRCGGKIVAGEQIEWSRADGASHSKCSQKSEIIPDNAIRISSGSGYGGTPYTVGQVIHHRTHGYLVVLSARSSYVRADGMSFGVRDESGYVYSAACRAATEEESAPLRLAETQAANRQRAAKRLAEIAYTIRSTGERPEGDNLAEGEEIAIDTANRFYGGGSWFVIGPEWIWYVRNNGMDGDDWSRSNVRTGGAGAIGWRVPYAQDIAKSIQLAKRCIQTGENINTATREAASR